MSFGYKQNGSQSSIRLLFSFQGLTSSFQILNATALATPFIVVRIVYLFLSVFQPSDLRWSDLRGPIAPFLTMGLLMEYSVVLIYLITGFIIPSWRNIEKLEILLDDATR